ncbi:MAG TPA: pitrilysin family protein [Candidatus Kapabacteria bacterium]|nr:pitrilysin family protein [Candidatus Kapabacteria bacterium]
MFDELRQGGERSSSAPVTAGIEFERFTHANGLEIILHQDRRAPIVHVMVWYHVGSKDETPDRTGLAHLFEHMMFQGSQNVGKTRHFTYVQGVGGSLNATTGQDRTNYFQTVPREYLGMALWLEADRMRSLKVTMENFENQRSVVKEERRQRYDNAPYGLWYMTLLEMLFGGTPYGWSPIGDMAHLDAAPLDAIQEFHRLYYVPNNATLVVCGDFEREEALNLIDQQFGEMPKGPPVQRPSCAVEAPGVQCRRAITANVPLPAVYLGFHSVPIAAGDAHALNVLALVLNRGRSSRLQRAMVYGTQTAQSVAAFNVDMESAGLFIVLATGTEDSTAERLEEELWGVIEEVRAGGVREREVEAALNHVRTSFVTSLCRLHGIADALAYYQVLCGDAGRINTLLEEFNAVTAADVERVARTYLLRDRAAVLYYLPA